MTRAVLAFLAIAMTIASPALPATPQPGISRQQAIQKARVEMKALLEFAVGIGATPATKQQKVIHYIDTIKPRVTRSRCVTRPVWRVVWPHSSAIVVAKGFGPQLAKYCVRLVKPAPLP